MSIYRATLLFIFPVSKSPRTLVLLWSSATPARTRSLAIWTFAVMSVKGPDWRAPSVVQIVVADLRHHPRSVTACRPVDVSTQHILDGSKLGIGDSAAWWIERSVCVCKWRCVRIFLFVGACAIWRRE